MAYGLYLMGEYKEPHLWRHNDIESAKAEALRIASEGSIEVMVFKIIGAYAPTVTWVGEGEG